jgi:hypothetical protein
MGRNTVGLRLIGEPELVERLEGWLREKGLEISWPVSRKSYVPGHTRRYMDATVPEQAAPSYNEEGSYNTELTLVYHPGGGEHPPAVMIRGQLGAVVVAVDKLPLLCGNLMGLHVLYGGEVPMIVRGKSPLADAKEEG